MDRLSFASSRVWPVAVRGAKPSASNCSAIAVSNGASGPVISMCFLLLGTSRRKKHALPDSAGIMRNNPARHATLTSDIQAITCSTPHNRGCHI